MGMPRNGLAFSPRNPLARMSNDFARPSMEYELEFVENIDSAFARPAAEFAKKRSQTSENWHLKQEPFCGRSNIPHQSRIVGGSKASFGQFPWQAQIWAIKSPNGNPTFTCGGTLVTEELILTAAHCIHYTNPERYLIKLGRQYVDEKDEICSGYEQRYKVIDLAVHPEFNKRHLTNDIAVMWIRSEKYNQPVHYADHILPACLPELSKSTEEDEFYKAEQYGVVTGWGLLNETEKEGSNSLQHVALPILKSNICLQAYGKFVHMDENKQFCAGNDQGQDACAGDSGGPFIVAKNGHHYLVGVVSYGRGCARPEYPGVYSNVLHYLSWINSVVGQRKKPETEDTTNDSFNSVKIPSKRPPTIFPQTTTPPPPPTPPPRKPEAVEKSTTIFCPSQYSLLRCSGTSTITVTKAVFALDTEGHCGQRQRSNRSLGGDCSLDQAEIVPKTVCDGRRTCWVYHNIYHQDPCPGQVKYSVIHYKCEG